MALVFYTQRDIANIDANNIPEEFVNYFDGLSEEGKKRIIDARPDLASVLGVGTASEPVEAVVEESEGESSDIVSSETDGEEVVNYGEEEPREEADVELNSEIVRNIYEDKDMKSLINSSLSPVHALIISDGQLKCVVHRKPLVKIQLNYKVKGAHGDASYGCQPYCCDECHRLFFEESKAASYADKFNEYGIEYKFFDVEESQKYMRSQMSEIEISASETLYVPDVWVEDNPTCPIHNVQLSEYPHVIVGEKRIAFKGFICDQCNKIMVRRTVALDIEDKCQEQGVYCPTIKPIRPEVKKTKAIKKKIRPQYMIEDGKRIEFTYGEANENTYILTEEDTVVVSDSSYCYLEGHETEQVEAVYVVSEKRDGKKNYISLLGYCSQCQKFYMDEADYKVIYSYGRPEFVVIRDVEEDEFLVTSGEVYNLEKEHLQHVEGDIGKEIREIKENGDYVSQTETASDYDEIAALQYRKSISREKYEPLLEELYQMGDVPYRYRVDIVFAKKTETYYIGAKDIVLDGEKKVISMASDMGRTLVNTRTVHYIKDGMQYDVKLSREFDIKKAYLFGYKNIKTDEDAVFRAGITDPFLIRVLNQRKRQHGLVDIFVTIQENQNTIVDERLDKNIIVQGCAGSGKTMVMLHRLYTLKYNHPEFDFSNALILTPNDQFSLHIKGLADSLQIGSIDRTSIEHYYLSLVSRYSKDFAPSNKIASEVAVKSIFVDYIYSDEFLNKFNEAYDEVIKERRNIIPVFETLYNGLKEHFAAVEVSNESEYIPELRRRYVRLAVLVQKNEKAITDAKEKLEARLKDKQNIESRLPEAESKANGVIDEVLPRVYTKMGSYISGVQSKIAQLDEEISKLADQEREVQSQFLPFGKKAKLEEIQKQQDSISRKKRTEEKKLEEAKAIMEFDRTDKTEDDIMLWLGSAALVENSIQAEISQCKRIKREYQQLLQEYSDIEPQILDATNAVEKAESEKYPEDVYKAVNYLNSILDNFSDYGVFKEVFALAIKDFAEKNKVKIPNGMHRYDLYISLWFCMKYYGRRVGDSKFICFDEGQDLAFNEYKLIYALNGKDVIYNIFGDTNQLLKLGRGISSWERLESTFFMKMFYLNENYRNTNQITRFCNQSFGMKVKQTGVDGAKVREIPRKELEKELTNLNITTERIAILVPRKVIKKNYLEMEILPERIRSVIGDKVDNGCISFMYVDEVKGIEFDKVFVIPNRMAANEKYIAYTRALSELIIVADENIPDVDDTESEKTEIGELVEHLRKGNMKDAKALYEQISDEWNEKQRISFFAHLFTRVNQHDKVLQLMGLVLSSLEIKFIYNGLSVDQVDSIKKKVYGKKLQELLQAVYESGNIEGFASLVGCMDVWNKIEFVPDENRRNLYLMANSRDAGRMWVDSISDVEMTAFADIMRTHLDLMKPMIAFDICAYAWKNTKISREQIVSVIEEFSKKNAKGKQEYSCPFDVLLSLACESDEEWNMVKNLVKKCSTRAFSFNKIKRYPQEELPEKVVSYMERLADSSLSLEQKIFMYMNTTLREDAQIDRFFVILKERTGVSIEDCLSEMRKYWLVGKIKYVTEDGFVRIVPHNITATRLVCFWSSNIHISGKDGVWVEPKVGDQIYFLLRRYDEEKNFFTVHYPCVEPMEVKE